MGFIIKILVNQNLQDAVQRLIVQENPAQDRLFRLKVLGGETMQGCINVFHGKLNAAPSGFGNNDHFDFDRDARV